MYKYIFFDYNGVIVNDFDLIYKTTMELFRIYGINEIGIAEFKEKFTYAEEFYKRYYPTLKFSEVNERYFQLYLINKKTQELKLYPNVKKTLQHLKSLNIGMRIISKHKTKLIKNELADLGIKPGIFSNIYGGVKDKSKLLLRILSEKSLLRNGCMIVGDSENDILAGKIAGITTVASAYGYRTVSQLSKANPDHIIDNIQELVKLLQANINLSSDEAPNQVQSSLEV